MKNIYIWGIIIVVILAVWYISSNKKSVVANSNNPIKIGAMLSLTGYAAEYGEVAKNAMELAVLDINKSGGVDGRQIELHIEDDHTDPKQAVSAFQKLVTVNKVDGVVGGMFDFATQPVFPVAMNTKTALISPINFHIPQGFELNEYSFVMLPDFSKVIRGLTGFLKENQTKKLAVVHFKSAFGQEIAKTLDQVMVESGNGHIVDEAYGSIGNNDFKTTILKLKQQKVDTVFLDMVGSDPVSFLARARELNFNPTVISYEGIRDSFKETGVDKSLLENVVILNWEFGTDKFTEDYQAKYGALPVKSANKSYDAVYVLAQAIAKNETGHDGVATYMSNNSFKAPSGTISFNKDHAVDTTPVKIEIIKNGELVDYKR